MPYTLLKTNGLTLTVVEDGTVDTTTDLTFIGKNYTGYGDPVNENFVKLLENFANPTAPRKPLLGQIWFDSSSNRLKYYSDSKFKSIAVISTGTSLPVGINSGDLHFDGSTLFAYSGSSWVRVGPITYSGGGGGTQLPISTIGSELGPLYPAINIAIDGKTAFVVSTSSAYQVISQDPFYDSFKNGIYPGITLPETNASGISGYNDSGSTLGNVLWGTAASAIGLVDYTNSVKTLVKVSDLVTKVDFAAGTPQQFISVDSGITINSAFQLHVTREGGIAAANISNIRNNVIRFNINTNAGTYTNFINFDGRSGTFRVVPTTSTLVTLGSPDTNGSFSHGYITNLVSTNVAANGVVSTNVTGTNASFTNLTVSNSVSFAKGVQIGTTSTINGARIWTTATLNDNSQLSNGAGYLTAANVLNYGVASVRGTSQQINVSSTTGNVTFSLPNTVSVGTLNATVELNAPLIKMNGSPVLTSASFTGTGITEVLGTTDEIEAVKVGTQVTVGLPSTVRVTRIEADQIYDNGSRVITENSGVLTFSGGNTGLKPFGATSGNVTLDGVLLPAYGGTGQFSYSTGDLLYASGATTLSKLAAAAVGNVLISNGPGIAPSWGKVGLTTHISGTLALANGGTGVTNLNDLRKLIFAAGTVMVFAQSTAPLGWTKLTTSDNAALRVVGSGTFNGTGGSVEFTAAFSSQAVSGTVGNTTLTIDQIPSHTHSGTLGISYGGSWGGSAGFEEGRGNPDWQSGSMGSAGGGQAHTHSFSGTSINLAVKYVDTILASKDA